jgi:hypothetical protein
VVSWVISFFFDPAFDAQMQAYDDRQDVHRLRRLAWAGADPSAAEARRCLERLKATSHIGIAPAVAGSPR